MPIISRLAAKPRLVPVIRSFALRLRQQINDTAAALKRGDRAEVARFAHWLAGSAGTVGYDAYTETARRLERCANQDDHAGMTAAFEQVRAMTGRMVLPDAQEIAVPA